MDINYGRLWLLVSSLMFLVQTLYAEGNPFYPTCFDAVGAKGMNGAPECIFHCPGGIKPVCGSDGVTQHNDCVLCRAACNNRNLEKACDGDCPCSQSDKTDENVKVIKRQITKRKGQPDEIVEEVLNDPSKKEAAEAQAEKRKADQEKEAQTATDASKGKKKTGKQQQKSKGTKDKKTKKSKSSKKGGKQQEDSKSEL